MKPIFKYKSYNEDILIKKLLDILELNFLNNILCDNFNAPILINNKMIVKVTKDEEGNYIEELNNKLETPFDIIKNIKLVSHLLCIAINIYSNEMDVDIQSFYQYSITNNNINIGVIQFENNSKMKSMGYYNQCLCYIDLIFLLNDEYINLKNLDNNLE